MSDRAVSSMRIMVCPMTSASGSLSGSGVFTLSAPFPRLAMALCTENLIQQ
jgi:hypothetical protein